MNDLTIAEYLDRRLSMPERQQADMHLAGCPECRDELAEVYEFQRRARRPRLLAVGGLAAAAAAIILFMVRPVAGPVDETVVRSGGDQAAIVAYGPLGEAFSVPVHFVWGAQAGATTYRLTVTGRNGTAIWSHSSADTAVSLPDSVSLSAGEQYRWVVDALLDDGASRSTGLREFRAMP
jgi:hypothetical protein